MSKFISFLLWIVVGVLLAYFLLHSQPPNVMIPPTYGQPKQVSYSTELIRFAFENYSNDNVESTNSTSKFKVLGIAYSSDEKTSNALIDIEGHPLKHYRLNEELPNQAQLIEIKPNNIKVKTQDNRRIVIKLDKIDN